VWFEWLPDEIYSVHAGLMECVLNGELMQYSVTFCDLPTYFIFSTKVSNPKYITNTTVRQSEVARRSGLLSLHV
jgi:hypothetical protein